MINLARIDDFFFLFLSKISNHSPGIYSSKVIGTNGFLNYIYLVRLFFRGPLSGSLDLFLSLYPESLHSFRATQMTFLSFIWTTVTVRHILDAFGHLCFQILSLPLSPTFILHSVFRIHLCWLILCDIHRIYGCFNRVFPKRYATIVNQILTFSFLDEVLLWHG